MNAEASPPIERSRFRHIHRLRVRWAEVDLQKIVFNGHYLMYLDTAVADYWRALALPYADAMHKLGGDLFVRKATLEYLASARYDDLLDIGIRCERIGTSSMRFSGAVFLQDRLLVSGELIYVFADPATQTSRPVPQSLRSVLEGYEAGEAMFDLRYGAWTELRADASALRTAVFIDEQGIAPEHEWDAADADAVHVVAFNRLRMPLATGRLLVVEPENGRKIARIGRLAVCQPMRGGRIGRAVLEGLIDSARQRGDHEVRLDAQTSAQTFYARAGFTPHGAVFDDAGLPHIEMRRSLSAARE
jgi:YbgC/YbaW family acyl-CoA thioester hydrolase